MSPLQCCTYFWDVLKVMLQALQRGIDCLLASCYQKKTLTLLKENFINLTFSTQIYWLKNVDYWTLKECYRIGQKQKSWRFLPCELLTWGGQNDLLGNTCGNLGKTSPCLIYCQTEKENQHCLLFLYAVNFNVSSLTFERVN